MAKNALWEKLKGNQAFAVFWQEQNRRLGRDESTITQALHELMVFIGETFEVGLAYFYFLGQTCFSY